ncbi:zinc ribbon domain-containing protein [Streptomyces sp. NPDC006476]|uniref:zinc ribbon domain-containing protein n=1 Tax=Streptomyces sp. NPDC006476 TaxID=3157175 RepID=UPI0033AAA9D6
MRTSGWCSSPTHCPPTSPSSSTGANLARLAANAARPETPGAIRSGPALLAGLVRCGRCGKRMTVRYYQQAGSTRPDYVCARQMTD